MPKHHDFRMQIAPFDLVGLNLGVGSAVVEDATPSADASPVASAKFGEFALLPLVGANLLDRPVQHLRGEYPIRLEVPVASAVVIAMQLQLPFFVRAPGQHPALNHPIVAGVQK